MKEVGPAVTQLTADRLVTGNDYHFRVKAINKEGESDAIETAEPVKIRKKIGKCYLMCFDFASTCIQEQYKQKNMYMACIKSFLSIMKESF